MTKPPPLAYSMNDSSPAPSGEALLHRIPERPQSLDVSAYGPLGDLQPIGEVPAGPELALLQQPE